MRIAKIQKSSIETNETMKYGENEVKGFEYSI